MEKVVSVSSNPRTVDEIFKDFRGHRTAIIRALTTDLDSFFSLCDPEKENLCLFAHPNESWEVNLPAEEVPPELPEPVSGINFARDGMQRKKWLSMVAAHSDAWLLSVAFFHGARFNQNGRERLFSRINDLPTVFQVITENKQSKEKIDSDNSGSKPKSSGKRMNDGQLKNSKPSVKDKEETDKDSICGLCEKVDSPNGFWIECDSCERWYHGKCVKISPTKAKKIKKYKCPRCTNKKPRR